MIDESLRQHLQKQYKVSAVQTKAGDLAIQGLLPLLELLLLVL